MSDKVIVAGTETVIPPLVRMGAEIAVFPIWAKAWGRWKEQVPIVRAVGNVEPDPEVFLPWVAEQILEHGAHLGKVLLENVPALVAWIDLLELLSERVEIIGVVVQNDVEPLTRASCEWGNRRGLPTIHIPHAHYFDVWRDEIGWDIHDEVSAQTVLAINDVQAEWYRARGAEDVEVVGNPVWDRWARWSIGTEKARSLLGLELNRPTVTYMTTWPQTTSFLGVSTALMWDAFRELCAAVKELDWQLVLLHHFRSWQEIRDTHLRLAREVRVRGVSTVENFQIALQAADVVTAFGPSNTLIEASIIGKPVFAIGGTAPPMPGVPADRHEILKKLVECRQEGEPEPEVVALAPYVGEAAARAEEALRRRLFCGD